MQIIVLIGEKALLCYGKNYGSSFVLFVNSIFLLFLLFVNSISCCFCTVRAGYDWNGRRYFEKLKNGVGVKNALFLTTRLFRPVPSDVLYPYFIAHHKVFFPGIGEVDNLQPSVGCRYLQCVEAVPFGFAEVVGPAVQQEAVVDVVELVEAAAVALLARLQQVFVHVHHAYAEMTGAGQYEFGVFHNLLVY